MKHTFRIAKVFIFFVLSLTACGTSSTTSTVPVSSYLMGGAMQGNSLSLAGNVTTFAGVALGPSDGIGVAARFNSPYDITTDGANLYVSDALNNTIRKIVIATGEVTTLAGTAGLSGSTDGTGADARFRGLHGITTDGTDLFVVDSWNSTIRKIVIATGQVTTLAGTAGSPGSTDGIGAAARFNLPHGITTNGTNLYVADTLNNTIRKIDIATGQVTTLAGTAGSSGSTDGIGAAARFYSPDSITTDGTNLYVTDTSNYTIRKIEIATGQVTTFAGTAGSSGSTDGIGAVASFGYLHGIATDGTNLYVVDTYTIRKIVVATGQVTTLAGNAGVYGSADGFSAAARFNSPDGITTDGTNLYVADTRNNTIRKIVVSTGQVTTFAGNARSWGSTDGNGAAAKFNSPGGIATDGINLYVADTWNSTIRKIAIATGQVTTLAGNTVLSGSTDGTAAAASFFFPEGITTDGANLYVADTSNHTIRKIVIATGEVTTLAGTAGSWGSTDGTGAAASFFYPEGITTDGINLYVADTSNNTIRKIEIATGTVTTIAGAVELAGSTDGIGAVARFDSPNGITTDGTNLYVADTSNYAIRKIEIATGTVATLAGTAGSSGSTDGIGAAARFYSPDGVTTDGTNLYVADSSNNSIRKIVIATGEVTTIAGTTDGSIGSTDGTGAVARFYLPHGITTDGTNLYVADTSNNTIRKIQ